MDADELKRQAARAALSFLEPGKLVGVGSGTTVRHFIEALGGQARKITGAVASSEETARLLAVQGVEVVDAAEVDRLPLYVDGADEANRRLELIKGGGGALTREKIVAAMSDRFICIADASKLVEKLGTFPLPLEVIPMARRLVSSAVERMGGRPILRESFVTDNGNLILDVHGLPMDDPARLESELDHVPGLVASGLFARRPADLLLLGVPGGVRTYRRPVP